MQPAVDWMVAACKRADDSLPNFDDEALGQLGGALEQYAGQPGPQQVAALLARVKQVQVSRRAAAAAKASLAAAAGTECVS